MTAEEIKKVLTLLGLIAIAGCGGGGNTTGTSSGGTGALAIAVTGAKDFNPSIEPGVVKSYRVKVEGAGITDPITGEFSGDATEGTIDGIPSGGGRTVSVEALNPNDAIILAGEKSGVETGSGVTEVGIALEAVPIFVNIRDKGTIDNTRLAMRLFSDPTHHLAVEDSISGAIVDADTNLEEIHLDEATGLGRISSKLLTPGSHKFTVRDLVTGRSSSVEVTLLDGTKRHPAPFAAASANRNRQSSSLTGLSNR
ncbi:MAG: hypothetical protein V2A66_10145 [Pseudomonadota bacterium]